MKDTFKRITEEDIEQAQDRNFSLWTYDLQHRIQKLYDALILDTDNQRDGKAKLDLVFVEIQTTIEKAEKFIETHQSKIL